MGWVAVNLLTRIPTKGSQPELAGATALVSGLRRPSSGLGPSAWIQQRPGFFLQDLQSKFNGFEMSRRAQHRQSKHDCAVSSGRGDKDPAVLLHGSQKASIELVGGLARRDSPVSLILPTVFSSGRIVTLGSLNDNADNYANPSRREQHVGWFTHFLETQPQAGNESPAKRQLGMEDSA